MDETPKAEQKAPQGDENVEFIIRKHSDDSNTTDEDF